MHTHLREIILIALFAALTAIGAFIKIPTPIVPYTLQYLFCAYSGILLGGKNGLYSQLLYIGIGLIGIPVFTQGGGPAYVLQPTFGYLIGFAFCSYTIGFFTSRFKKIRFGKMLAAILTGLIIVYLVGVAYLYLIIKFYLHKAMTVTAAIAVGFTPYILPDILLSILIAYTAVRILPILRKTGLAISDVSSEHVQ